MKQRSTQVSKFELPGIGQCSSRKRISWFREFGDCRCSCADGLEIEFGAEEGLGFANNWPSGLGFRVSTQGGCWFMESGPKLGKHKAELRPGNEQCNSPAEISRPSMRNSMR